MRGLALPKESNVARLKRSVVEDDEEEQTGLGQCQHPSSRASGVCSREAVAMVDIPDDYTPPIRHITTPPIPRPQAALCRPHRNKVRAHSSGVELAANSHEAQCDICRHPRHREVVNMWVNWLMTTKMAVAELGVSHRAFYNHVAYFNLMAKRVSKNPTNAYLAKAAELGMEAGGHTIQSGLRAMEILDRRRTEGMSKKVDHNIRGFIGTADMSRLSSKELAELADDIAAKLRVLEDTDDDVVDGEVVDDDDEQLLLAPPPVQMPAFGHKKTPIRVNNGPVSPGEQVVGRSRVRMTGGKRVHKPRG